MAGDTMLRVGDVKDEAGVEAIRDALDVLGVEYEHVSSEPENSYPQTVYFYISENDADDVENAMQKLAEHHGFDAEVL